MRVIAGKAKGLHLKGPKKDGRVRPLTDQARGALFNILGERVVDSSFLDLFAGTGAVGIEALSRGAKMAFLVEYDRKVVPLIRQNLEITGLADRAEVFSIGAVKAIEILDRKGARFDLIFMGAPYDSPDLEQALGRIAESGILHEEGILVAEHRKQHPLPESFGKLFKFRDARYGETVLSFYKPIRLRRIGNPTIVGKEKK